MPRAGGDCERVVCVAFGLFWLILGDRNARTRRQRQRPVKAVRRRDGVIGPAPGRGQIAARQRGLGHVSNPDCRTLGWRLMWCRAAAIASSAAATSPAARAATTTLQRGPGAESAKLRRGLDGRLAAARAASGRPWYASMTAWMNRRGDPQSAS